MSVRREATTRAEVAYGRLRADILAGRLRPGAKLPFAELCARYEASAGVIREGLSRLVEQGLVRAEPQLGFRVATLSIADLEDLTDARCIVEGAALRASIERGDLAWEGRVVAAHHSLERTPQASVDHPKLLNEEWAARHRNFHHALLDGAGATRLTSMALSLRDSAELYRRWSQPDVAHDPRNLADEHRRLVEAVLGRDADRAVELMTRHLRTTAQLLTARAAAERLEEPDPWGRVAVDGA